MRISTPYTFGLRLIGTLLTLKSVLFITLSATEIIPIPMALLLGMALTWLMGAILLFYLSSRVRRWEISRVVVRQASPQIHAEPLPGQRRQAARGAPRRAESGTDKGVSPLTHGA